MKSRGAPSGHSMLKSRKKIEKDIPLLQKTPQQDFSGIRTGPVGFWRAVTFYDTASRQPSERFQLEG